MEVEVEAVALTAALARAEVEAEESIAEVGQGDGAKCEVVKIANQARPGIATDLLLAGL